MAEQQGGETSGTVLLALVADVGVALVKIAGGVFTGSASLLAEAAHSVADTSNQVFLLISLRRAKKPADAEHPWGYGKERFFWSLLAAIGIFVSGAGFSLYQGVDAVVGRRPEPPTSEFVVVYVVLAISLLLDGASLVKAVRQVLGEARRSGRRLGVYVGRNPDPTVKTVFGEDSAAVLGVFFALAGTVAHQLTHQEVFDGAGSFAIALLLAVVAIRLGKDAKRLLIDSSADPAVRVAAVRVIADHDEVERISEVLTLQLGPEQIMVAARVQFREDLTAGDVERICTAIETELAEAVPGLTQVFIDPSAVTAEQQELGVQHLRSNAAEVRELDGEDSEVLSELLRVKGEREELRRSGDLPAR